MTDADPPDDQPFGHPVDLPDEFDESEPIEPSAPMQRWRRGTASGALLSAVALGLREALEPPREEAPIEIQTAGEPPSPRRVEADLDPDDPSASIVTVRPWVARDE